MNGDGRTDLVTGSFGGLAYVLHGLEERSANGLRAFAPPVELLSLTGDPVCIGMYRRQGAPGDVFRADARMPSARMLSIVPVDWDDDGDLDLVAGEFDGRILLFENDGTREAPEFKPAPRAIRAGRKSLWVRSGHSMVTIGDWDGDGRFDIASGSNDGAVFLWRNTGEAGAPAFAGPVQLLSDPDPEGDGCPANSAAPTRPWERTQPHFADIDGDGQAELLVGDYRSCPTGNTERPNAAHGYVWVLRRSAEGPTREPIQKPKK